MRQWYIRFKAGNFENGYYEIGENFDLVKDLCKSEFIKDCKALGFTPITAELTYCDCLLYTSPSPRDKRQSRMPSSA